MSVDRFWAKVDKNGPVPAHRPDLGPCWLWTGYRYPKGYGRASDPRVASRQTYAHRLAWELTNGPIPDGMQVLHACDNPPCCNPAHLSLGSNLENVRDREAKGRGALVGGVPRPRPSADQCRRGHPLDAANTYVAPNGHRECRICARARVDRYRARRGRTHS